MAKQLAVDQKGREPGPEAPGGPVLREGKCLFSDVSLSEAFAPLLKRSFRSSISKI